MHAKACIATSGVSRSARISQVATAWAPHELRRRALQFTGSACRSQCTVRSSTPHAFMRRKSPSSARSIAERSPDATSACRGATVKGFDDMVGVAGASINGSLDGGIFTRSFAPQATAHADKPRAPNAARKFSFRRQKPTISDSDTAWLSLPLKTLSISPSPTG